MHHGLARLRAQPRPGLAALARVAGLDDGVQRTSDISLAPGAAPQRARPARRRRSRRSICCSRTPATPRRAPPASRPPTSSAAPCRSACSPRRWQQAEAQPDGVLVVAGPGWHAGVVGIVAAKLVDRFARPAVVVALDAAARVGVGSARTVAGFHLHRALVSCADLLVRYGGHAAAAGLTIDASHLGELRARLSAAARAAFGGEAPAATLGVDAEIALDAVDELLAVELGRLEPYGIGNPEPVLGARGVTLDRTRVVGENHLQVTLRDGLHARDGIGFWLAARDPGSGARVRAAFIPEVDTFRGVRRVRVRLRDLALDA